MVERLKAIGYDQGFVWDDGSDHEGVSKIYVRGGLHGIQIIQCEYVKKGQLKPGKLFGVWNSGFTHTVCLENILSSEWLPCKCMYFYTFFLYNQKW